MKKSNRSSILSRLQSFNYAFNGIKILIREESNALIHVVAAIIVISGGFILKLTQTEWIAIVFAIGFVLVTEVINSSIERLCDLITPEKDEKIKKIKDLAAAGVLISAFSAGIIGIIIFLPKILYLF
jgi:diacylglycerol kinase (ATP)